MAKYVFGAKSATRINGVGDLSDEWIEIRRATFLDAQNALGKKADQVSALIAKFIVDWSITDESGSKVPITPENFEALPLDIVAPAVEHFNSLFLPLEALAKRKSAN